MKNHVPSVLWQFLLQGAVLSLVALGFAACQSSSSHLDKHTTVEVAPGSAKADSLPLPEASPRGILNPVGSVYQTNTVLASYDRTLILAVKKRWHALLAEVPSYPKQGVVVLDFELWADGSVFNPRVSKSTVAEEYEAFCKKAILDSSPFAPWPEQMHRLIESDTREVRFMFYFD